MISSGSRVGSDGGELAAMFAYSSSVYVWVIQTLCRLGVSASLRVPPALPRKRAD